MYVNKVTKETKKEKERYLGDVEIGDDGNGRTRAKADHLSADANQQEDGS